LEFAGVVLLFLTNPNAATTQLDDFAGKHGVNTKALKNMLQGVIYFFTEALKRNMSSSHVAEDLVGLGLKPAKAGTLSEIWIQKFSALSQSMIDRTLVFNEVVDMEWKFGVSASSDELNSVGACFLQLKLVINRNNHLEDVLMEMTLPQFYKFLQQMQNASRQCDLLSKVPTR
jgi:hypothetical protein